MKRYVKAETNDAWSELIHELEYDCEDCDPLYEETSAGDTLLGYCYEVERELPFWLEPSVQGGMGGIWIYENDTNETIAENIDYQDFNYEVLELAFQSNSADEFKAKYKDYLLSLVEE